MLSPSLSPAKLGLLVLPVPRLLRLLDAAPGYLLCAMGLQRSGAKPPWK